LDAILASAETALRRNSAPALRLGELLYMVRADTRDVTLDSGRLRAALEGRPDRFRVLDPWRGPWRSVGPTQSGEPWVVVVGDPGDWDGGAAAGAERTLRESVRWLALTVDAGSLRDVGRWHAIAVAEPAARAMVRRKAA
jgi:hypothetical protein